jgi:hypothetical protein
MSNDVNTKKEEYKRLVIEAITEEVNKPSSQEHEDVRAIAEGLEKDLELELKVVTGGLCNYGYKLQFEGTEDPLVFVKLTFGTPLLFPDVNCSPDRTEYEFKIMKMFAELSPYPDSCVKPYLCFDIEGVEENMKVLVMQYSSRLEEQAGHIFIDGGIIDQSFATKIATSMSALHNAEVTDPNFNEEIKQFLLALTNTYRVINSSYFAEPDGKHSRTIKRAHEIGKEKLEEYVETYTKNIFSKESYIHGDFSPFNFLVESTAKSLENESRSTDIAIVDWEFSCTGPIGKDIGWSQTFPIACALAHSVNGDSISTNEIILYMDTLWEKYSASIDLDGKNLSLTDLYRRVVGYCGTFATAYAHLGVHMDHLPIDEDASDDLDRVIDSLGVVALEGIEMGFLNAAEGASLEELRERFKSTLQKELDFLSPVEKRRPSRRKSSLRSSGRRVSDAHSYFSFASESEASEELLDGLPNLPYKSKLQRASFDPKVSLKITDLKRVSMNEMDTIERWYF